MNLVRIAFATLIFFVIRSVLRRLFSSSVQKRSNQPFGHGPNRSGQNPFGKKPSDGQSQDQVFEAEYTIVDKD